VAEAICISCTTLEEVANESVRFVRGFFLCPVERFTGVVLLVAYEGYVSYLGDSVGKVVKATGGDRISLTFSSFFWKGHESP
jgi:hypothetical protein